jgi:hypothetical protein
MNPEPGKYLITIRVERPDGQFVTSSRLVPAGLLLEPRLVQGEAIREVGNEFIRAYRRAADLPS